MSIGLSEQPIDYTGINGEVETQWANPFRQLDTVPSVFGPHPRFSRPGGGELVGAGAIISDGSHILLVRQNRWPNRVQLWEMPLGASEEGETLPEAALREVREETGAELAEADLIDLGRVHPNAASIYGYNQVYFAHVDRMEARPEDDEEIAECAWVPIGRVVDACANGEITEATTVVAVLRAQTRGLLG
jgi:8-oxo-dGTP pyrophosphatase MutT (NUDIX family)